ncbi:uncharacterized mitochondrial protein AtMg00810-like [Arachis hypogaea]|uniref:uncharacterized mitochondrial protein AtMg00810-like n=1 Tax=Arachis hypogaea TaxID=3818 RepID=UPI000DEC6AFB|nr:uncharacterized protein LOC112803795 [Arachis hypogaea]
MGSLHYFLGIQVTNTSSGGLCLTQHKYIKELMKKANIVWCIFCHTPLPSTAKLSDFGGAKFHDPALYRSIIGNHQYLTVTKLEISYIIGLAPDDKKSTSGYCVFLGSNLVSCASRKQTTVAKSSIETKYRSMADLVAELMI